MNHPILPLQRCIHGEDIKSLSDMDLLAIILGSGSRDINVFELSSLTIRSCGGLPGLFNSGIREIAANKGIGLKKAVRIHAAFELGRRVISLPVQRKSIDSPGNLGDGP